MYATSYSYDSAGQLETITYPSGRVVSYARNALGEINQVTSNLGATQKTIIGNATYAPFGPLTSLTYGNGLDVDYSRRNDYLTSRVLSSGGIDETYSYDNAGNVTGITNAIDASLSNVFSYDALNRLTSDTWATSGAYSASVLADSPVAYWRLGEMTGTTAQDISGNGHDATYHGTVALGTLGLVAGTDTAAGIQTSGAGLVVSPQLTGETLTGVEMWFSTDDVTMIRDLFRVYESGTRKTRVYQSTSGKIGVWVGASKYSHLVSDAPVSVGVPHHIAIWYESATNTSYMMIDGSVQQRTYAGNALAAADPDILVAGYYQYGNPTGNYKGVVDEVAAYTNIVDASTFAARLNVTEESSSFDYGYDSNGNRTSLDDGTSVVAYAYDPFSNRLATVGGSTAVLDAAGNQIGYQNSTRTFSYNDANRLYEVHDNGSLTATYQHNALGQRVSKSVGGADTVFVYDLEGNLIAEHDSTGAMLRDYIRMYGTPVAQVDQGETFTYLHFDHLGTPRQATDDSQTVVWLWDVDAFGSLLPDEDPDGDSNTTTVNLRFPGQYFDVESGLHYNYYRTYDPATGRYLESDPIGLQSGLNTYGYAYQNPLYYYDPTGEFGIAGAIGGIVSGYLLSKLTGCDYGLRDVLADGALGAAGAGLASKLSKLNRLRKLRNHARQRDMQFSHRKNYTETWKGPNGQRLNIKHEAAKGPNLEPGSYRPRFDFRTRPGTPQTKPQFWDPLTGRTGPAGDLSHVPLYPPLGNAAALGAGAAGGAASEAGEYAISDCGCQ